MTAVYEHAGVRFQYPENWELDNRDDSSQPWSVSVHSPSGAFWSLTVHKGPVDIKKLSHQTLKAVEEDYQESFFESEETTEEIAGHSTSGYGIKFFYLDFLVSAKLLIVPLGPQVCLVLYQAEDRDFEELEDVFRAITYSLFL